MAFNPFQPSAAFHIETSHLFCSAKQMTGFYMKRNTGLKWVNLLLSPRHFQNPVKHHHGAFRKIVDGFHALNIFAKSTTLDV